MTPAFYWHSGCLVPRQGCKQRTSGHGKENVQVLWWRTTATMLLIVSFVCSCLQMASATHVRLSSSSVALSAVTAQLKRWSCKWRQALVGQGSGPAKVGAFLLSMQSAYRCTTAQLFVGCY
jgi:hypothetical protein